MVEAQKEIRVCPSCGKPAGQAGICCKSDSAVIDAQAEVVTADGRHVPLSSRWFRIGRDNDNDIVLIDDTYVSRYHAWITFESEHFWVEDLGSTNGTLLNGQPLQRRELLACGDKIKIGESEMTFVLLGKTGSGS